MSIKDYSKDCSNTQEALNYVVETGSPAHVTVDSKQLTIISKDTFNKLTADLDEDDLWYLGFLGNSKKHAVESK